MMWRWDLRKVILLLGIVILSVAVLPVVIKMFAPLDKYKLEEIIIAHELPLKDKVILFTDSGRELVKALLDAKGVKCGEVDVSHHHPEFIVVATLLGFLFSFLLFLFLASLLPERYKIVVNGLGRYAVFSTDDQILIYGFVKTFDDQQAAESYIAGKTLEKEIENESNKWVPVGSAPPKSLLEQIGQAHVLKDEVLSKKLLDEYERNN